MNISYLSLGGNIGNTQSIMAKAVADINETVGKVTAESSVYETEPWGFEANQNFCNIAIAVETDLSPLELLHKLQSIEKKNGRIRSGEGYSSRPLDIDIITYNSITFETDELTIPHKLMHKRKFVLEPLNEIAPSYMHPILKKRICDILEFCDDNSSTPKKL